MRSGLAWLGLGVCWACGGKLPAPTESAATVQAAPRAAPAPPPVSARDREVEPKIWTTAPDTDACTQYLKQDAPEFSQFDSQPACEEWVQKRRCRPGMRCSDGCNGIACDGTGMHTLSTLVACELGIGIRSIEFREKSVKLPESLDLEQASRLLERALRFPKRKLKLIGVALPSEGASPVAVKQLARKRAEAVARALVLRGADRRRFVIEVLDASTLGMEGYRIGRVFLQLDPSERQPEEYDASYPDYENLCWIKYPSKGQP